MNALLTNYLMISGQEDLEKTVLKQKMMRDSSKTPIISYLVTKYNPETRNVHF